MDAAVSPPRKPRMERDAVATRARILAVATRQFARRGFEGATTDDIADKAEVNKRMIYHYFGSKEQLYLAVLEEAYGKAREAEEKLRLDADDPVSALMRLAEYTFDSFARDRTFISLLNTENRNEAKVLKKSLKIKDMNSTVLNAVDRILRQGEASGAFRSRLDAFQVWVSMVSLSYFYFSNIHTLSIVAGRRLSEADALAERRRHMIDFLLAGVRA